LPDGDVGRDLPSALAFVFETQDEHGEAVESEAPDDAESVGFAEEVDGRRGCREMVTSWKMTTMLMMRWLVP